MRVHLLFFLGLTLLAAPAGADEGAPLDPAHVLAPDILAPDSSGPRLVHHRITASGAAVPSSNPHGPGGDDHGPPPTTKQGCSLSGSPTTAGALAMVAALLPALRRRSR